jgi:phosphoglycolate phosphatase
VVFHQRRADPGAALSTRPVCLFDLDGTLIDSRPGIVACFRHALGALGRSCPAEDFLASTIGKPFRQVLADMLDTADGAIVERAVLAYRERYSTVGLYEACVYPGIVDMLAGLDDRTALIATSKTMMYATRVVDHFGLAPYFRGVYGAEPDGRLDRKDALLSHLLDAEGLRGVPAVMIGDRADDVRAAGANGLASIGVLWGYGSEQELEAAGADALCASPGQLGGCLSQIIE